MPQKLDLERLRHAHAQLIEAATPEQLKSRENALNAIRGHLLANGLLHAIFSGRKEASSNDAGDQTNLVFAAMTDWLSSEKSLVGKALQQKLDNAPRSAGAPGLDNTVNKLVAVLMRERDVGFCMAVQSEATRYLGQFKVLLDVYKPSEQETEGR